MWLSLLLSSCASTVYFPVLVVVQIALWHLGTAFYLDREAMLRLLLAAIPATGVLCSLLWCRTMPTPTRIPL